jgi:ribosome-binding factor A
MTVTKVDISPDLRQGTVWVGIVARTDGEAEHIFSSIMSEQSHIQAAVASQMATKFVPKLSLKRDNGGAYAEHITRLIRGQ